MASMLPPELTDKIIGLLHDDSNALGACSLTCRAWVTTAQAHIFRTVWLGFARAESFVKLLATSPHIAQYVGVLVIEESQARVYHRVCDPLFVKNVIPQIAPKLVNVQELDVTRVAFGELDASARSAFIESFPSLRRLALFSCTFGNFQDLTSLILGHPYIEYLELQSSSWNASRDHSEPWRPADSLAHLRSLSWGYVTLTRSLIHWMLSTSLPTTLHTIKAPAVSPEDIPAVSGLLDALGPSLEHFDVGISSIGHGPVDYDDASMTLSVSNNTSLHTLCIENLIGHHRVRGSTEYAWIPVVLSTVRSSSLEEITLRVWYGTIAELEVFALEQVDDILAHANFDALCRIVFWLYGSGDRAAAERQIKRRMKSASERELLVFK